jgi:hypothetical protein
LGSVTSFAVHRATLAVRIAAAPTPVFALILWRCHDLCDGANFFLGFEMPQTRISKLGHSSQFGAALGL